MKILRKFFFLAVPILLLVSCKKYDVKPVDTIPMYKDEISVDNYDPGYLENFLTHCFFSLNGYTADPIDINEGNQSSGEFDVKIN